MRSCFTMTLSLWNSSLHINMYRYINSLPRGFTVYPNRGYLLQGSTQSYSVNIFEETDLFTGTWRGVRNKQDFLSVSGDRTKTVPNAKQNSGDVENFGKKWALFGMFILLASQLVLQTRLEKRTSLHWRFPFLALESLENIKITI